MRVKRRTHDEGGAVAVMIALALVVLLGMLALVVDLGRAVGVKRDMVNAADAAALAAAQQCALGNGPVAAQGDALASAELNGAEDELLFAFEPAGACSPELVQSAGQKFVHVRYGTLVDYFVAPVLGFDNATVVASATAMWMVPGVVPITVNSASLLGCPPTDDPEGGEECILTYLKGEYENPRWGIIDVTTWGDADAAPCPVPNSEVVDIINGGGWPRPDDAPQFACVDNGRQFNSWDTLEGGTWWFPVIDILQSTGIVVPGGGRGVPCTGADIPQLQQQNKDCSIQSVWVTGFVQLKVIDVQTHGSTNILVTETVPAPRSSAGIEIRLVD